MVNQDFTKRIAINSEKETWHKSPSDGVERLYLERDDGGESAVATTIVRFAPGSKFDEHLHDGGEEFIVLEGTFSDEFGSYPKGTYVRNPKRYTTKGGVSEKRDFNGPSYNAQKHVRPYNYNNFPHGVNRYSFKYSKSFFYGRFGRV